MLSRTITFLTFLQGFTVGIRSNPFIVEYTYQSGARGSCTALGYDLLLQASLCISGAFDLAMAWMFSVYTGLECDRVDLQFLVMRNHLPHHRHDHLSQGFYCRFSDQVDLIECIKVV